MRIIRPTKSMLSGNTMANEPLQGTEVASQVLVEGMLKHLIGPAQAAIDGC